MPLPCPNAKIVYKDKTYDPEEFRAHLKTLPVQEMAKYITSVKSIPSAPFEKTWHEMALRRILKQAADSGYDGVSWTPGEDQNKRYSLSHQVDKIAVPMVNENGSRSVRIDPIGGGNSSFKLMVAADGTVDGSYNASQFSGKKLDEVVGKEMAEKIMSAKEPAEFEGKGLDVGGSGMKGFYDKIVPDYLNKFGKKFGAKVGSIDVPINDGMAGNKRGLSASLANDPRFGMMDLYATVDSNGNWTGISGDPDASFLMDGERHVRVATADGTYTEEGKKLDDTRVTTKAFQYLPITPEMRKSVGEEGVPLFNRERRVDSAKRKRVEDMTPDEMRKALLTSDVTGAPNRRAFDDAEHLSPAAAIGMSDADGLKALNDKFGYAAGNELLKAKAEALKDAGLEAYHEKGDEFLYRGESPQDLKDKLEKARNILRNRKIEVTLKDGRKLYFKGADFSYGTGKDLDESEDGLKQHKQEREDRGERKRGQLVGINEVGAEGSADDKGSTLFNREQVKAPKADGVSGKWSSDEKDSVFATLHNLLNNDELLEDYENEGKGIADMLREEWDSRIEADNDNDEYSDGEWGNRETLKSSKAIGEKLSKLTDDQVTSLIAELKIPLPKKDRGAFNREYADAAGSSLDANTSKEGDGGKEPEQVEKGSTGTAPTTIVPIAGGTKLTSAPIMIPAVPVPAKHVLPLHQIKMMAAGLNPNHNPNPEVNSVRELMNLARARMIP